MENIINSIMAQSFVQQLVGMRWSDFVDIIIVAALVYMLLPMLRTTGASRIAKVVIAIFIVAWLANQWELYTLSWLINQLLAVGLIAIVILYQPELRRMLDRIGNLRLEQFLGKSKTSQQMDEIISQTVMACEVMSRERVGALMVFARDFPLDEYIKTGTQLDAQMSEQLIRNIFFPKAALHDGAMIICNGRMTAAGCVLPLSDSKRLSADLGTRHRAGGGMSEGRDAVVVIVSDETGAVSVAVGGMLKRHLAPQTLEKLLHNELCPDDPRKQENLALRLRQKLQLHRKGKSNEEE